MISQSAFYQNILNKFRKSDAASLAIVQQSTQISKDVMPQLYFSPQPR